jgi:NADP-dependent 3-hydroxy acid dehydrogenase YdfG
MHLGFLTSAIAPDAVARAVAFAIKQPPDVDVNEIVIRPTAQALNTTGLVMRC